MDKKLCETVATGQNIEKLILATICKTVPINGLRLVNADAKVLGIQGYVSKVLQVRLTWSDSVAAEAIAAPISVIVKCPTSVNLQRMYDKVFEKEGTPPDASVQVRDFHNDEMTIYEFLHNDDYKQPLEIPIPRYFGGARIDASSDGILIVEDLSDIGHVLKSLNANLNSARVDRLTEALATLHAWSYIRWSRNGTIDGIPTTQDRLDRWTQMYCKKTPELIAEYKKDYPKIFGNAPADKLLDLFSSESYASVFGVGYHSDKLPVVLVHGDIQPMNIFYSSDEPDGDRLVGLIDFQLSHKGYGTEDLARVFSICTSNEFKRKHGDEVLRRYTEVFNNKIKETALQPITFENVKAVFTAQYAFYALAFAMSVKIVDQFVEGVEDAEERKKQKAEYIQHCEALYRDAVETLGW